MFYIPKIKHSLFARREGRQGFADYKLALAAEVMGDDPGRCVVVEDSPAGIDAAKAAGLRVVAFAGAAHRLRSSVRLRGPIIGSMGWRACRMSCACDDDGRFEMPNGAIAAQGVA